jgi:hypothetical protein
MFFFYTKDRKRYPLLLKKYSVLIVRIKAPLLGREFSLRRFYMFKKKIVGFSILLFFALLSLFPAIVSAQTVPFETIAKGDRSCYRHNDISFSGADMVINDLKTWSWFWQKHLECIQTIVPVPLPRVDFRKEMVLVAMPGYQTSGGGPGIEISSIEKIFSNVVTTGTGVRVIVLENETPGPLTVITNPYHIVKSAKNTSVVFEHEPMEKPCIDNADCSKTEFCEKPDGYCKENGVCTAKPEMCPLFFAPACGCDMITYNNPCEANRNGISILYMGPCR